MGRIANIQAIDRISPETRQALLDLQASINKMQAQVDRMVKDISTPSVLEIPRGNILPDPIPQKPDLFVLSLGVSAVDKFCISMNNSSNVWKWNEIVRTQ